MKLRSYLIPLLVVSFLFSCSKDDDFGKTIPEEPAKGMLSLIVDADVKTKADTDPDLPQNERITRLTILVFKDDASGAFVAMKDTTLSGAALSNTKNTILKVNPFSVSAGSVQILAIANAPTGLTFDKKSLSDVRKMTVSLGSEVHGQLTMNSKVLSASIKPNVMNLVGRSKEASDEFCISVDPMNLYRNVARIELSSITLGESAYGTPVSFDLDSVFVANVKSQSSLVPSVDKPAADDWGTTEIPFDKVTKHFFWHGAYKPGNTHYDGPLRDYEGVEKAFFVYNFKTETNWVRFPYYDENKTKLDKNIVLQGVGASYTNDDPQNSINYPVGNFFYAYENMTEAAGAQTVLVVSGTYTYIPEGQKAQVSIPNRYYAVVVNKDHTKLEGVANHSFVKRNTKYRIAMTLTGPGSDKPYDPSVAAHVSAEVKVLKWNVIELTGKVD